MFDRTPRQTPSPAAAVALFLAVSVVNVAMAFSFNALKLPDDLLMLTTPAVVLLLTLAAVAYYRVDVKKTLLLRLPSGADLFMAFPLAISFFILGDQLSLLTQEIFPVPEEFAEGTRRLMEAHGPLDWVVRIASIGVGAAVSEELMFRGFIQTAFLERMSKTAAILWMSFLFMLIHFVPLPAIAAAGVLLGFLALATRSILIPMVVHFTNNFAGLLLVNLAGMDTLGEPLWIPPTILLPAIAIFALTTSYYLRKLPAEAPKPERDVGPERPRPLSLPASSKSLSEELQSVPRKRRRLGWLVVIASVLLGVSVLSLLFGASVYRMYPQQIHEGFIEGLRQESERRLVPAASENRQAVMGAFDALSAANEAGHLGWRDIATVIVAYSELTADGSLDETDADALIEKIRDVVIDATRPRRL